MEDNNIKCLMLVLSFLYIVKHLSKLSGLESALKVRVVKILSFLRSYDMPIRLSLRYKGGPGSGNKGHAGIKGHKGGSAPGGGGGGGSGGSSTEDNPSPPPEHATLQGIADTAGITGGGKARKLDMNVDKDYQIAQHYMSAISERIGKTYVSNSLTNKGKTQAVLELGINNKMASIFSTQVVSVFKKYGANVSIRHGVQLVHHTITFPVRNAWFIANELGIDA